MIDGQAKLYTPRYGAGRGSRIQWEQNDYQNYDLRGVAKVEEKPEILLRSISNWI